MSFISVNTPSTCRITINHIRNEQQRRRRRGSVIPSRPTPTTPIDLWWVISLSFGEHNCTIESNRPTRDDIEDGGFAHIFSSQSQGMHVHAGHAHNHWYANDVQSVSTLASYHYSRWSYDAMHARRHYYLQRFFFSFRTLSSVVTARELIHNLLHVIALKATGAGIPTGRVGWSITEQTLTPVACGAIRYANLGLSGRTGYRGTGYKGGHVRGSASFRLLAAGVIASAVLGYNTRVFNLRFDEFFAVISFWVQPFDIDIFCALLCSIYCVPSAVISLVSYRDTDRQLCYFVIVIRSPVDSRVRLLSFVRHPSLTSTADCSTSDLFDRQPSVFIDSSPFINRQASTPWVPGWWNFRRKFYYIFGNHVPLR